MSPGPDKPSAKSEAEESAAASSPTAEEDKTGYKKPPKAFRFVKGRSGNPKGRKKAKRIEDVGAALEEVLYEPVQIREGDHLRTTTRLEATIQALRAKALQGDPKSIRGFLKLAETLGMFPKSQRKSLIKITEPDGTKGKIIRMYHAEQDALQGTKDEVISKSYKKTSIGQDH